MAIFEIISMFPFIFYNHTDMNTNTGTNNSELVQQLQQQLIQAQQHQLNSGNNGGYRNNMNGTSCGNLQCPHSFHGICYAMQDEGFCPNGNACTYQHYVGGKSVYCGNSSGGNEAVTTTTTGNWDSSFVLNVQKEYNNQKCG